MKLIVILALVVLAQSCDIDENNVCVSIDPRATDDWCQGNCYHFGAVHAACNNNSPAQDRTCDCCNTHTTTSCEINEYSSCVSRDPRATDDWCQGNCFHFGAVHAACDNNSPDHDRTCDCCGTTPPAPPTSCDKYDHNTCVSKQNHIDNQWCIDNCLELGSGALNEACNPSIYGEFAVCSCGCLNEETQCSGLLYDANSCKSTDPRSTDIWCQNNCVAPGFVLHVGCDPTTDKAHKVCECGCVDVPIVEECKKYDASSKNSCRSIKHGVTDADCKAKCFDDLFNIYEDCDPNGGVRDCHCNCAPDDEIPVDPTHPDDCTGCNNAVHEDNFLSLQNQVSK